MKRLALLLLLVLLATSPAGLVTTYPRLRLQYAWSDTLRVDSAGRAYYWSVSVTDSLIPSMGWVKSWVAGGGAYDDSLNAHSDRALDSLLTFYANYFKSHYVSAISAKFGAYGFTSTFPLEVIGSGWVQDSFTAERLFKSDYTVADSELMSKAYIDGAVGDGLDSQWVKDRAFIDGQLADSSKSLTTIAVNIPPYSSGSWATEIDGGGFSFNVGSTTYLTMDTGAIWTQGRLTADDSIRTALYRGDSASITAVQATRLRGPVVRGDKAIAWGDSVLAVYGTGAEFYVVTKPFAIRETLKTGVSMGSGVKLFTIPAADSVFIVRCQLVTGDTFRSFGVNNDTNMYLACGTSAPEGTAPIDDNILFALTKTTNDASRASKIYGFPGWQNGGTQLDVEPYYNTDAAATEIYFNYGNDNPANEGSVVLKVARLAMVFQSCKAGAW